jgi:Holliday junction DNA helicase RuvA
VLSTLTGTVVEVGASETIIEVGGVGFQVYIPAVLSLSLHVGTKTTLHTVLIPREDELSLFGFSTRDDKQLFNILRGVSGVGPKTALAIIGSLGAGEIARAVSERDDSAFKQVSGVGAKTASLIIVSLTGKMPQVVSSREQGLSDALVGLGWPKAVAAEIAKTVAADLPDADNPALIRESLSRLSKK